MPKEEIIEKIRICFDQRFPASEAMSRSESQLKEVCEHCGMYPCLEWQNLNKKE